MTSEMMLSLLIVSVVLAGLVDGGVNRTTTCETDNCSSSAHTGCTILKEFLGNNGTTDFCANQVRSRGKPHIPSAGIFDRWSAFDPWMYDDFFSFHLLPIHKKIYFFSWSKVYFLSFSLTFFPGRKTCFFLFS